MKALLATPGRFHIMALARELQKSGSLSGVVSGFPTFALKRERIDPALLFTVPFFRTLHFGLQRLGVPGPYDELAFRSTVSVDRAAAALLRKAGERPDIYMALSQTGTLSGRTAKTLGVTYVCDRGSTHILEQQAILADEYRLQGRVAPRIDPRSVERELIEYETSDLITVPSHFVQRTFVRRGVDPGKVVVVPYGANLGMFRPTDPKPTDSFDILFVGAQSFRKGIPYLVDAYAKVQHPRKRLTLIGVRMKETDHLVRSLPDATVRILGPVPQVQLAAHMSAAHVLILPSVEEGLALVMAEAMACGCPVLATKNTGAEDLFDDGEQGFIVEARDVDALANRLQIMADDPTLVEHMSIKARAKIESIGGWADYAGALLGHFARVREGRPRGGTEGGAVSC